MGVDLDGHFQDWEHLENSIMACMAMHAIGSEGRQQGAHELRVMTLYDC